MTDFQSLSSRELQDKKSQLLEQYREFQSQNITLDMTRGKPCSEQLDLAMGMMDCLGHKDIHAENGSDCRNYGGLDGIPEAKKLFAEYMGVHPD